MTEPSALRVDLHAHTWYSGDSITSPELFVRRARAAGLDRIAVTDHGTLAGAIAAKAMDPELVIIGEEIHCAGNVDLIGLFLTERIPNGLPIERTADLIRQQGGVVYSPHPYAYLTRAKDRANELLAAADVVEVFNARGFLPAWNRRAARAAKRLGLPGGIGSDAHLPWEIGRAYLEMPHFTDAKSFLSAIASADQPELRTVTALVHLAGYSLLGIRSLIGRGHGVPLWSPDDRVKEIGPAR